MDKRQIKIQRTLQMAMLRLQDSTALQRVEVEAGQRSLVLKVDPAQPQTLQGEGIRVQLKDLPAYLLAQVEAEPRAGIRFLERGTQVNIELYPGDVKMNISTLDSPADHHQPVEFGTRQQFIQAGEAMELLQALGIASSEGKVRADRRRKYYQVDRFVELVDEILKDWRERRPLVILDCGCGKSYLSFVLNYWLTEKRRIPCKIIGIDGNAQVIEASRRVQRRLNYRNMEFLVSSIRDFRPREKVDMVLSLHACDTATDEALALGIHLNCQVHNLGTLLPGGSPGPHRLRPLAGGGSPQHLSQPALGRAHRRPAGCRFGSPGLQGFGGGVCLALGHPKEHHAQGGGPGRPAGGGRVQAATISGGGSLAPGIHVADSQ